MPRRGRNMAKRKAEFNEGPKARRAFEEAMRYAFSIPKEKAPAKPRPERNRNPVRDAS